MQYQQLGSTGSFVSRVALGTMTFAGAGKDTWDRIGGLGYDAADELVGIALDHGVNLVDTADMYAGGDCEEYLGRILRGRRDDVFLATKAYARVGTGPNDVGLSRVHLTRALEASLRRLRTDHIDLYQVHAWDHLTPVEETLATLDDAVRQGKVRYVGASNMFAWQLAKALGVSERERRERFVSLQAYYSLVGRDLDHETLPLLRDAGLGLLVYSPLAGGFLTGKFTREGATDPTARRARFDNPPVDLERGHDILDVLRTVAERHGASPAQTALAWALARPGVTSVIVGARRPDQLRDNLGAADLALTTRDLAELDAVSEPRARYPQWALDGAYPQRTPAGA
ncbi:aldo/keto reductase [Streptomyces sp. NPDC050560]|uniref:aldo/keto reductase n=1 Tax=Streptomyces sp. NPDC050560 TaxID=3365630 RepID=UPI0037A7F2A4